MTSVTEDLRKRNRYGGDHIVGPGIVYDRGDGSCESLTISTFRDKNKWRK